MSPHPAHDSPEASSSTAADKATSTLRARLRSEEVPSLPSVHTASQAKSPKHSGDMYKQLRAHFATMPRHQHESNPTNNLAESFALQGQDIYDSSLHDLQLAHEATSSKIAAFQAQAATTSTHTDNLYNNISYRLSATICHSENYPRANIGTHIHSLRKKLFVAEGQLNKLNEEWKSCIAEEVKLMAEREEENDHAGEDKLAEFWEEIDGIARRQTNQIEEIEEKYRDLLWAESNRMMQAMMAD
ncbi:hypothetical protein QQS21_001667 [Conoideocrella luteorostrata]|uniref:Uncharacterized protein n=1 Tax=Conoideocrella luteorostrata TaxID=1105319 RepID=A0AAJ0G3A1_9HYPO|nr:hypothetical protein QQS21_001667 [Conoideocrella luteorostrata]